MSDLAALLLPKRAEVTIEPYDWEPGNRELPTGFIIGVQLPSGSYDPRWPPRCCFTEPEACALAGVLSGASGCPVRGVDP